jgi:flagellar biosynthetic protein FliO
VNEALVTLRTLLSLAAVLALLAVFVWALRRGSLKLSALAPRGTIAIETATSLGDRRSIAIVGVEGRRLLVGLTPTSISLLTDLTAKPSSSAGMSGPLAVSEARTR